MFAKLIGALVNKLSSGLAQVSTSNSDKCCQKLQRVSMRREPFLRRRDNNLEVGAVSGHGRHPNGNYMQRNMLSETRSLNRHRGCSVSFAVIHSCS
jgi:hypothetical protein